MFQYRCSPLRLGNDSNAFFYPSCIFTFRSRHISYNRHLERMGTVSTSTEILDVFLPGCFLEAIFRGTIILLLQYFYWHNIHPLHYLVSDLRHLLPLIP